MIKKFLLFLCLGSTLFNSATFCQNEDHSEENEEALDSKSIEKKKKKKKAQPIKKVIAYISIVPTCVTVSSLSYFFYVKVNLENFQRKITGIHKVASKQVKNAIKNITSLKKFMKTITMPPIKKG